MQGWRPADWSPPLISLTRFHQHDRIGVNPDLIERVEETPDTVVTLTNGSRYLVEESLDDIIAIIEVHRARVAALAQRMGDDERETLSAGRLRLLRGRVLDEGDPCPASEGERP